MDAVRLYILNEELSRAHAPALSPFGLTMVGPVIYTFGSQAQKERYLPKILSGEEFWCQGYSEPGSGSDLASLQTKAIPDGNDYIVNGQKTWTSYAQWADMIFCLVRTSNEGKIQEGISFLLIDMKSPGIEVAPIVTIDGGREVNNTYFTDVRVPIDNRVGEENKGWTAQNSCWATNVPLRASVIRKRVCAASSKWRAKNTPADAQSSKTPISVKVSLNSKSNSGRLSLPNFVF